MDKFKYPRTYHLPYSPCFSGDDKRLVDDKQFDGMEVSVSVKMDGENTTVYPNGEYHARSLEGFGKKWQTWLGQFIQGWCFDLPEGWRVCGENLYAKHSIGYTFPDRSYLFQVFGIYDDKNRCLPIDEELDWCKLLNLRHVDIFYRGVYDKDAILGKFDEYKNDQSGDVEGFVVRDVNGFPYSDFSIHTGKYVRPHHVQTDEFWARNWTPNRIAQ